MKKNELPIPSMIETKNKKYYTSPKIEVIGGIQDTTRGAQTGINDVTMPASGGPTPSLVG